MSYAEEYDILKNSIKNIMPDMAMVRIETLNAAYKLIETLNSQLKLPTFYKIEFEPSGVKSAVEILSKARDYSLLSKQEDTEIIFIIDKGALNIPEPDQIDFWETMNAQREIWGSLKAYIIFITLPEEYDKALIIAHHLTDWIPLKIDLLKKPDQKPFADTQKIISDAASGISGKTALSEIDNLLQSFKEAEKKGEKSLIRRFLLPAFNLAVDAVNIKKAEEIRKYIDEEKIQRADLMQWMRLNFKFYFYTSENRKAEEYLLKFKKDAEQMQDKNNIASSYFYTGSLKSQMSENKAALKSYEMALSIYKEIRDSLGKADCMKSIGDIHLRESRNCEAFKAYKTALPIYEKIGAKLGEANCIKSIGDIHLRESRNVEALKEYESALSIYNEIGEKLGEANCIRSIGEIHLRESRNNEALEAYKSSLSIYKEIRARLGEANCINGIGQVLFKAKDYKESENHFKKALKLYEKINDSYSIAEIYLDYGRLYKKNKDYKEKGIEFIKNAADIFDSINIPAIAEKCRQNLS